MFFSGTSGVTSTAARAAAAAASGDGSSSSSGGDDGGPKDLEDGAVLADVLMSTPCTRKS